MKDKGKKRRKERRGWGEHFDKQSTRGRCNGAELRTKLYLGWWAVPGHEMTAG